MGIRVQQSDKVANGLGCSQGILQHLLTLLGNRDTYISVYVCVQTHPFSKTDNHTTTFSLFTLSVLYQFTNWSDLSSIYNTPHA